MGMIKKRMYDTAQVVKKTTHNEWGTDFVTYYIEYTVSYFGLIKVKRKFFAPIQGYYYYKIELPTEEAVVEAFNKFIDSRGKKAVNIKRQEVYYTINKKK